MCGIVGLFIKDPALEPELGSLLVPMLEALSERGPDSTGIAVYRHTGGPTWRVSLRRRDRSFAWEDLARAVLGSAPAGGAPATAEVDGRGDCGVLETTCHPDEVRSAIASLGLPFDVFAVGRAAEVIKDIGDAADVCRRMGIAGRSGYQAIGHTRMATESAITVLHSHPFSPAPDLNLVHNGSFSNHATVRRRLMAEGVRFDSDNDSEVAARLIAHRLDRGDGMEEAVHCVQRELDGFFTLLMATATDFAVVRDAFACKPAAVAETDRYVAVASEYRALAGLPDIESARVFEPAPEVVYTWSRPVEPTTNLALSAVPA
jgi:amidophosphoribosyltransferase